MTAADRTMLQALADNDGSTAGNIGSQVWGRSARKPQAYARPAAKALYRLMRLGYATQNPQRWGTFWRITRAGEAALSQVPA